MNKVECEILGLSSSPSTGGAYALLLKETYGARRLPIIIGQFEAQAIALELEGIKPPRPLTHDLLKSLVTNLGAAITEVYINELRDNTFFAKILLEVSALTNEVDSRPSDAIAVAIRAGAPIFVDETVLAEAGFVPSQENEEAVAGDSETAPAGSEEGGEPDANISKETKIAQLQTQLKKALEVEEYERAAKLRDEIQQLSGSN